MDIHFIYKITFPSGKVYIGRTYNVRKRIAGHKRSAFNKNSSNSVHRAMRKYGRDNWKVETLAEIDGESAAIIMEEKLIKEHDSVRNGYNDTYNGNGGGDIWKGRRDTEEYKVWLETMKQISSGENNSMYGKSHKNSSIKKMKQKAKGRFSLPWYQERYGISEGTMKYEERCQRLKNRKLTRDKNGKFICKSQK
jgi:group I intron endonuclease